MANERPDIDNNKTNDDDKFVSAPSITMPKGGGAIHGIGEKFSTNPVTGAANITAPIYATPGRTGFGPQLSLSYDSSAGNGVFGLGWSISNPSITRKTDNGLPQYLDAKHTDAFVLSGSEDLVPVLVNENGQWQQKTSNAPNNSDYVIQFYRPRVEGLFARIERWTHKQSGISHWRSISKDNITTLYGSREDSRISDPTDPTRVFSWLISESYDDKGNAILYSYKPEDAANVDRTSPSERNRLRFGIFGQKHLKYVRYGNRTPRELGENLIDRDDWLFEVVFDYGEHDENTPTTTEIRPWLARQDAFSTHRSTFELRTYRLCRRVLMFHHFPDEFGGLTDCLVRSTDIAYNENPVATYAVSVTQTGYTLRPDRSYTKKSLPKLEFAYSTANVDETVHEVDEISVRNLPYGVDGSRVQWVDLDSEGLSGVLSEEGDIWYYKRNLGDGTFGPAEIVSPKPSIASLARGQQLLDLAGEGRLDIVQFDGPMAGYHERTPQGGWDTLRRFKAVPNINTKDPNLRFVDVTGDGHTDILISEDNVFTWFESQAKEGFAFAKRAPKNWDEEKGPKLVFSDPSQSVFLADMSGDGLSDIVRIRYDEVCYWPNLGYGLFGAKVQMGSAPLFDTPDQFDPKRIQLADIDGSGVTDIIYIGHNDVTLYFNQSGNSWSKPRLLANYSRTDSLKHITVMDLLGKGTACLVWSSPLASDARKPMRYIDLMGKKPHLLEHINNNLGAVTVIQYTTSTKFYLQDRLSGRPWVTKLSFPVHTVERVETRDLVSNTKLVSTYRYAHGYFDGFEREFRGFAYVEQSDAESVVDGFDLPPVVTKTWFHTGALLEGAKLEAYFKDPANGEYFTGDGDAVFLPDTELPEGLDYDEMREAARALKGSILRQEVYTADNTDRAGLPYSVSERSYKLTHLQPRGPNRHAVFFAHPSETIDCHYERNPADPRISHALTLEVDNFGNVLKSAAIGYQRRAPTFDEQKRTLATLTENIYTNIIDSDNDYRMPLPAEIKTYELTAPGIKGAKPLTFATVADFAAAASEIAYETQPTPGQAQKRPIEQVRTLYRKNDLSALLPTGKLESLALLGEQYKAALTPGILDVFQPKISRAELSNILTSSEGGYRNVDGGGQFWLPSGKLFYSPNFGDSPQQEAAFARAHFYLPHRFQDPFGAETVAAYDAKYNLALVLTRDAVGNETIATPDYRVFQPQMVTDPNGARTEFRFDALGMVVATALCGKAVGPVEGDSFTNFVTDLTQEQIKEFFDAADPRMLAHDHLGTATTRVIYDLERVPACAVSIARETHVSMLGYGIKSKTQLHFVYSDGFGREAQTRAQAEPGPLDPSDPTSPVANPRWVATGEKVYNNKGKPVRQYEPFFSATPQFGIENWGVSSTLFYDPTERVIATVHPNHTYEKVVFDPWRQITYDVNDTVTFDPATDPDVGAYFARLPDEDYLPTWYQARVNGGLGPDEQAAATKTAKHANTPTIAHFDGLGRIFLTIADNGVDANNTEQKYRTRLVLDIEGNQREVIDALDRVVMRYDYDMLGVRIHQASMEAGERWMLNEVTGKQIRAWNSRKYAFRTEYDALRRPLKLFVQGGDPSEANPQVIAQEALVERTIYGDSPDSGLSELQQKQANLRGKVYKHFDGAGVITTDLYDFKGNSLRSKRQFATDYREVLDWLQSPALETETFASFTTYDALNRPITVTAPDDSVYRPTFNDASLLDKVDVNLRGEQRNGQAVWTAFINNIDYNAKGQRTYIQYANGADTAYDYDPKTFRLTRLKTTRPRKQGGLAPIFKDAGIIQDLHYVYDPTGNITRIEDAALSVVFNGNQQVKPVSEYTYDPLYRLVEAKGREHITQSALAFAPSDCSYRDYPFAGATAQTDLQALRNFTEQYDYDPVGNFNRMIHQAAGGNWTRAYTYAESSQTENTKKSNRLSQTTIGSQSETYLYDAHGSMTLMPHLPLMAWDFKDQLRKSAKQTDTCPSETTYYVYDASGQRARKVTERQNGMRKCERFYLGGFEIYREFRATGGIALERETLHVMDDTQRVALVETKTIDGGSVVSRPTPKQRIQLTNHLGSASLELDKAAGLISYEEYAPYGGTTFKAGRSAAELSLKRYRYTGKERDEENGFTYHGARYYAPWLGRWSSCDPKGLVDGENLFSYTRGSPATFIDKQGFQTETANKQLPTLNIRKLAKERPALLSQLLREVALARSKEEIEQKVTDLSGESVFYYDKSRTVTIEVSGRPSLPRYPYHCTDSVYNLSYKSGLTPPVSNSGEYWPSTRKVLRERHKLERLGIIDIVKTPRDNPHTQIDESTQNVSPGDLLIHENPDQVTGHHMLITGISESGKSKVTTREAGTHVGSNDEQKIFPSRGSFMVYRLKKFNVDRLAALYRDDKDFRQMLEKQFLEKQDNPNQWIKDLSTRAGPAHRVTSGLSKYWTSSLR